MIANLMKMMNGLKYDANNGNVYISPSGRPVPRVTEIIHQFTNDDGLMNWANSLGFRRIKWKEELERYANIGTSCHNNIDAYLENGNHILATEYVETEFAYNSFLRWFNDISNGNNVEIILREHTLVSEYFGGTLDGLYRVNGKYYLIDYKTTSAIRFTYFLQLAAYRRMLKEIMGIELNGCIILQLSRKDISYNEAVLNFDSQEDIDFINNCEESFLSMALAYYTTFKAKMGFDNIIVPRIGG